jgi:hypothetical protein
MAGAENWIDGARVEGLDRKETHALMSRAGAHRRLWNDRFVGLLPHANRIDVWRESGQRHIYHYASVTAGVLRKTVNEVLRFDRRLEGLPQCRALLHGGRVSLSKLRPIATLLEPGDDEFWATRLEKAPRSEVEAWGRDRRAARAAAAAPAMVASSGVARKVRAPFALPDPPAAPARAATHEPDDDVCPHCHGTGRTPKNGPAGTAPDRVQVPGALADEITHAEQAAPPVPPAGPTSSIAIDTGTPDTAPSATEGSSPGSPALDGGRDTDRPFGAFDVLPRPDDFVKLRRLGVVLDPLVLHQIARCKVEMELLLGRPVGINEVMRGMIAAQRARPGAKDRRTEVVLRDLRTGLAFEQTMFGLMPIDDDELEEWSVRVGPVMDVLAETRKLRRKHRRCKKRHSRRLPAATMRVVLARSSAFCEVRGCCKLGEHINHIRRKALASCDHDPDHLVLVCRGHHDLFHQTPSGDPREEAVDRRVQEERVRARARREAALAAVADRVLADGPAGSAADPPLTRTQAP